MTAFGHTIFSDHNTTSVKKPLKKRPQLHLKAYNKKPFLPYDNVIKFLQNQGRDVFLCTTHSFDKNVNGQMWSFIVADVITFIWEKGSSAIYYEKAEATTSQLLEYWFLHTLLPIYFTIEGIYEFIHAGGVEIDSKPVLFIAPSYGGKSTLTDHFIKKGHTMVSDDRVALFVDKEEIVAVSSYDHHRPYRKMEDLGIKVNDFMIENKPLHVIYVLENTDADKDVTFDKLQGIEKFKALQYNFDFTLPLNKARSFELIAKIASKIEIYRIIIPWDLDRLDLVYQAICEHSKNKVGIHESR